MPYKELHILVLLRETADPRPPARLITRGAGISDRGLRWMANQSDLSALEEALSLKDSLGAVVTVLTVGPERNDDILRLACSMGADRAIRVWDHGLEGGDAVSDALLLARVIEILKPTLLFSGNRLTDRGNDPVPALAAAQRSIPCVSSVLSLTMKKDGVEALRKSDRGGRQVVSAPIPCTVLFEEVASPRYPSVSAVTDSLSAELELWDLAHLGLPFWEAGSTGAYLAIAEFSVPRPDPVRVVTPDPELPAFERILSLLSGGIKARDGKLHHLSADETAGALWQILTEEGLVKEGTS